jgi:hypothetical protein
LKSAVHATLQRPEPKPTVPESTKLVYLICDGRDRGAAVPLRKFLKSHGLDVEIPVFEGDAATVRRANQDIFTRCHAVMLFYGAGDEAWRRTVESDLKKMSGSRRENSLLASYKYLAQPFTDDKKDLIELEEPNLINGLGASSEGEMKPFLDALRGV